MAVGVEISTLPSAHRLRGRDRADCNVTHTGGATMLGQLAIVGGKRQFGLNPDRLYGLLPVT